MQRVDEGIAFQLADAISWFNQKHVPIDNCRDMDLRDDIKSAMEQDLLRWWKSQEQFIPNAIGRPLI